MPLYSPAQPQDWPRARGGRRRFDILTIGLHWATVALITGMFASAWLLLASDREHAAMLLTIHRSVGVVTWAVAIVRLGWRISYAYLPPFPASMPTIQQRLAKASEYGLYALLLFQPLTGLAQSLTRGRHFMLFAWQVPKVMAGDKPLTALFHQIPRAFGIRPADPSLQARSRIHRRPGDACFRRPQTPSPCHALMSSLGY